MTIHVCSNCHEAYDDNASHDHVCPDDERDVRLEALEQEVAELRRIVAELIVCSRVALHRPPKAHDFIVLQSWLMDHEGELD